MSRRRKASLRRKGAAPGVIYVDTQQENESTTAAAVHLSPAPVQAAPINRLQWVDRSFLILASLAQIGLLALGVFGYFYTVLPVFQNQLLQEQAAKLELEKRTAQEQLTAIAAEKERLLAETAAVRASLVSEKALRSRLVAETESARASELASRKAAKTAQTSLQDAETTLQEKLTTLDKLRWAYFLDNVSITYVFVARRFDRSEYGKSNFVLDAAKTWPNVYKELTTAIDYVVRTRDFQVPIAYADELRRMLKAREGDLDCPLPDLRKMQDKFNNDLAGLARQIKADTDSHIAKVRAEYEAKSERIQITDEFRTATEKVIRGTQTILLESQYREELLRLSHDCSVRGNNVLHEIRTVKVGPLLNVSQQPTPQAEGSQ